MTTMTTAQLPTIQNTPRDLAKIASMGVFGHRKLAEQLASEGIQLWATEMEKSAFITADPPIRAQRILGALQQWDSTRGGAPAQQMAPAPMQQTPMQMQPMQMQQPMQPMMQPMQMPQQQMPPQAEPPREPSNEGAKKTRGGNGAGAAEIKAITDQLNLLSVEVAKITGGLDKIGTGTDMHVKTLHQHIEQLEQRVGGLQQVVHLTLGMVATMAQEYLGAGGSDLVEMAVAQGNESVGILAKAGKAQ